MCMPLWDALRTSSQSPMPGKMGAELLSAPRPLSFTPTPCWLGLFSWPSVTAQKSNVFSTSMALYELQPPLLFFIWIVLLGGCISECDAVLNLLYYSPIWLIVFWVKQCIPFPSHQRISYFVQKFLLRELPLVRISLSLDKWGSVKTCCNCS